MVQELDGFSQDYLRVWNAKATVRGMARFRLTEIAHVHNLFPAALQPLVRHEAVRALGEDALRELLIRTAYRWQIDIAELEIDVVTELCGRLANRPVGFVLPDAARHVALTIATDEAYHAYVAREFVADAVRLSGVTPAVRTVDTPPIVKALEKVRLAVPAGLRREADIMVLCFAENFAVEELFGLSRDVAPDDPFRIVVREHLIDEGRHQVFFQRLLRHMWWGLDEEARTALGRLVPVFLDALYLDRAYYTESYVDILQTLGFDRETGRRIVGEAYAAEYGAWDGRKTGLKMAAQGLNLVDVAGIADHPTTRALLASSGWLRSEPG